MIINDILDLLETAAKTIEVSLVPNRKWDRIMQEVLPEQANKAIQITAFNANSKFLLLLESILKSVSENVQVIELDQHWRKIFICKKGEEEIIICASWYRTDPEF